MAETVIGVMNTSKEVTDILQTSLEIKGYKTYVHYTHEIKKDERMFDRFIKEKKPEVIVYDIAVPYDENYRLFERLLKRSSARQVAFVLTTTNKRVLESLVGPTKAYEIIGKPYDLNEIVLAVERAVKKLGKVAIVSN